MADLTTPSAIETALGTLHPSHFGFWLRDDAPLNQTGDFAWQKTYTDIGKVYFTRLDWQHANQYFQWGDTTRAGLEIINVLQHSIWALTETNLTSALDMANLVDTGGSMTVAYRADVGLTPEGWLGFVLGYGARNGVLASRFLAVQPMARNAGLARDMKLLQAYAALQSGHHAAEWTFDPMRSLNAHLNFNKLGAVAERYKINKYGKFKTSLYGDVPSDRFVVRWNLTDPIVQSYLRGQTHRPPVHLADIPAIVPANMNIASDEAWPVVKLTVPYSIDELMASDASAALAARATVRAICVALLNAEIPHIDEAPRPDPAFAYIERQTGRYRLTQVVADAEQRHSFYIFHLKDSQQ